MSIKVVRGKVNTGERVYLSGEYINSLSEKDEQELVDLGVCQYAKEEAEAEPEEEPTPPVNGLPEGLKEVARGSFELPDGTKVKGRAKAIEALEAYNQALAAEDESEDDTDDDGGPKTDLTIE